jgi:FAD/FMN-containing dehydrogenase
LISSEDIVKAFSYLKAGLITTGNIIWYAASSGRYLSLEGRVRGGVFQNWAGRFRYAPAQYERPTTEAEIVELVKGAHSIRVFGSGHSFNDAIVSDDLLVSLDHFSGLVGKDLGKQQITVKGGTRIRDVVRLLAAEGLAFQALPSHDAQSIGGILSTDVHGTGRDWGFVSESVVRLTLVDGRGDVHVCEPSDELFRAAIGGVGAVGIITEVVVQGVPRFNVAQQVVMKDLAYVREHLDEMLAENEHLSLYVYPYSDTCQVNTWNRTDEAQSPRGDLREFLKISLDALLAAWVGNFLAYARLLPLSRLWARVSFLAKRGSNLVLESNEAFNRSIYHLHQEVEFTVPYESTFEVCDRFMKLYEQLYRSGLPYTLIELRFTPAIEDRTLIGAGRGRRSTWVDLLTNDSDGFEVYYAAAEKLICEIGARPHLGKFCERVAHDNLAQVHGESFRTFLRLVAEHDPDRKFANAFTRRLLNAR